MSPYICISCQGSGTVVRSPRVWIDELNDFIREPCPSCSGEGTVPECASCGNPLTGHWDDFGFVGPSVDVCGRCVAEGTDEDIDHDSEPLEPEDNVWDEVEAIREENRYEAWLDRCMA